MSTAVDRLESPSRSSMLQWMLLTLILVALFYPILPKLVGEWYHNEDYSHGFLIPLIAGYLVWRRREDLSRLAPRPSHLGLLALICTLAVYIVSVIGSVNTISRLSIPAVLLSLVLFLGGWSYLRQLAVPLGYLIFMVPIPFAMYESLSVKLRLFVSVVSTQILHWIAIPVFREGNLLHLPSITLEVANPCSGIRSLSALFAFTIALAIITLKKPWKQVLLVAFTVPIAVGTNVLRMLVTALLVQNVGPAAIEGTFHEMAGMVVFVVALGIMGIIAWVLSHERA